MVSLGPAMLIGLLFMGIGLLVSWRLKQRFAEFSKIRSLSGLSGREIAERMLHDYGIYDVQITCVPGQLTDHYNPADKTVNLSEAVYNQRNAAAAAVAAHECGHAVQHATAYSMLEMRSKMVPIVNVSSTLSQWLIMGGLILGIASKGLSFGYIIAVIGLILMAIATVFSLITLPVEYDASNRALAWLKNKNMVSQQEYAGAEDALKWAARTYVVAAIGAVASMLYWALQVFGRRD